ncbi:MAG TPA: Xaa-Pro peptidase family protein [Pseudolabrys sp.]|nr:Xaa-Pro peptidase family protein [Pseudolabrys sp.]
MRDVLELPRLSLKERDRRWRMTRAEMEARGLDCLVLWGWPAVWDFCTANARYLSPIGGNAEFNVLVFPLKGEPTSFVMMPTFVPGWLAAQDWITDVRAKRGTWADSVVDRLKELGVTKGRIGIDGLASPLDPDGWLPHSSYQRLIETMPQAEFVNLDDMMEIMRTVKSEEELQLLASAACIGDHMLAACRDLARPGVKESEVYGRMMETMIANGGEEPTLFLWACDALPYPHPFRVPTVRPMVRGDVIICEIHPKTGGYYTHVERTFSLGKALPEQHRIYDGCIAAYEEGMRNFGPGKPISVAMNKVRDVIHAQGFGMCETGIHGHGLASLEYPRYRHHAIKADEAALAKLGDAFKPGMVFAFNIDLFDPKFHDGKTGCVFAETVVITETGARRMHDYPMDFQTLPV